LLYCERWMKAFPTVQSVAKAKPDKIHKLWEGLGYYTRVRNMQKAARLVMKQHGGELPTEFEQVLSLPGIGRYTAGAICSIAFNQPRPILDGNVIRVLTRVFTIEGDPKGKTVNAALWDLAGQLVREADRLGRAAGTLDHLNSRQAQRPNCSHLNQALMELGALVCTPRQPQCEVCPLRSQCISRKQNRIDELPALTPRATSTRRRFVAFVVERNGKFLVRQRPADVVNAHLWEFPNVEVAIADGDPRAASRRALGVSPSEIKPIATIRHSITRYRIRMDVYLIASPNSAWSVPGRWLDNGELRQLAFASAHKKILEAI